MPQFLSIIVSGPVMIFCCSGSYMAKCPKNDIKGTRLHDIKKMWHERNLFCPVVVIHTNHFAHTKKPYGQQKNYQTKR